LRRPRGRKNCTLTPDFALFGWSDAVKYIDHNDELEAASQRARKKLPELRSVIQRGLAPG